MGRNGKVTFQGEILMDAVDAVDAVDTVDTVDTVDAMDAMDVNPGGCGGRAVDVAAVFEPGFSGFYCGDWGGHIPMI